MGGDVARSHSALIDGEGFMRAARQARDDGSATAEPPASHTRCQISREGALHQGGEHFPAAVIIGQMPRYAINPPLHVRGSPGLIIRSTDDAVRFVRATSNPGDAAAIQLVSRLESVRNPEIAQGLADELRAWINQRGLSRVVH